MGRNDDQNGYGGDDWVNNKDNGQEIIEIPITGELDLHTFRPSDTARLVKDYIEECSRRGILDIRIIHGKGKGVLRRIVRGVLDRHPLVMNYRTGEEASGSWGATLVHIKREK
ncbi:MAG: Smr/MutS family protein [Deltaproteobacteria bacterium]|nr:Smr/MutS family protein [Deltaproteobacteria bacterium]